MIYTLSETELYNIVKECLEEQLKHKSFEMEGICQEVIERYKPLLCEMAFKRKEYKQKIDNLSAQVIENWCLIRHCSNCNDEKNKKHWKNELKGHMLTLARYNIKGTEKTEDKEQAIHEVWNENDYFEPKTIEYVIYNKFRKEKFDTHSIEFMQIIHDCINSFNTMIPLISVGNIEEIYNYVEGL